MNSTLSVVTAPATEPVSLADAKKHLRLDQDYDDTLVQGLIVAARTIIEQWTARCLINQTLLWTMSQSVPSGALPLLPMPLLVLPIILTAPQVVNKPLELPRSPVSAVNSVVWTDTGGDTYTLVAGTDYVTDLALQPARVRLTWLTVPRFLENIQVQFVAGYGATSASVPAPLIAAVKIMLSWLYEHRGDNPDTSGAPPQAIEYLIAPYRIAFFGG